MFSKGNVCALFGRIEIGTTIRKTTWSFLQILEIELLCVPVVMHVKKRKLLSQELSELLCSLQHYLKEPTHGNNPNLHPQMKGIKKM